MWVATTTKKAVLMCKADITPNEQVVQRAEVSEERNTGKHKHTCKLKRLLDSLITVWRRVSGLLESKSSHSPLISVFWPAACYVGRVEAARQHLSPLNIFAISSGRVAARRRKQRRKGEAHWLSAATAAPTGLHSRILIVLVSHIPKWKDALFTFFFFHM